MAKRPEVVNSEIEGKINSFVDASDDKPVVPGAEGEPAYEPQYRMVSDQAIPISKSHGKLWESRKKAAAARIKNGNDLDRWNTALRYYRNDHSERLDADEDSAVRGGATNLTTKGRETENIVFANASALIPAIYAKNPSVEMTVDMEDAETFTSTLEQLVNVVIRKRAYPGVNLKPKARRAVLMSILTNCSYIEVGWTDKMESSEDTLKQIQAIGTKMQKAKRKDLPTLEAQLLALETKVDLLHAAGAWIKFRKPHDVLRDPDSTELDDASWLMIAEFLPTEFLKVQYGKEDENGDWESVYKPTHVLKLDDAEGATGIDGETASFSLFNSSDEKSHEDYGFSDDNTYRSAQRTKVWYVWDKATRRVYLYADNDWKWPLWVWDDPYGYDNFFPIVPLEFYTDPTDMYARSETLMYLDQQDAINEINNEVAKVRSYAVGKVIYNTNVIKDENLIESFLGGTGGRRALGVKVDPNTDLTKAFAPLLPQSAHVLQSVMFDKQRLLESINRVSSVTDAMRGVEYKTNTTNKAIESYQSTSATRLDEKIDAVEDFIGAIGWKLAQLLVSKMEPEEVGLLIGARHAEIWAQKPDYEEFKTYGSCQCVGGSTLKPTSATKKEQAVQIGQILGQFASVTPVTFLVALKVMERAFDDVVITDKDWQMITGAVEQALGAQQAAQQQQGGQGAPGGGQPQGEGGGPALEQVEQFIDQLPQEAKQLLGELIAKGAPIKQAVSEVADRMKQTQDTQEAGPSTEPEEAPEPDSGA